MFSSLVQDLRYAARTLLKSRSFTAAVVLTLAFPIGLNSTLFSLANAFFGQDIPGVDRGSELVWVAPVDAQGQSAPLAYVDYSAWREGSTVLTGLTAFAPASVALGSSAEPERLEGALAAENYFAVLGVRPAVGRLFAAEESSPGAEVTAVISHSLWRRRFASDPGIVGRRIELNGTPATVLGVAGESFSGPVFGVPTDVWVPAGAQPQLMPDLPDALRSRHARMFRLIGRLPSDVPAYRAMTELTALAQRLRAELPALPDTTHETWRVDITPLRGGIQPAYRADAMPVLLLAGAVTGVVLLIACANVAGLLISRAVARRREIGIRLALGASRRRLLGQLLTESLLLWSASGVAAFLLGLAGVRVLVAVFEVPAGIDLGPDLLVLGATLGVSLLTGSLFGLVPALQATRLDISSALSDGTISRSSPTSRPSAVRMTFVTAQLALSLLLLVVAGLFLRVIEHQHRVDLGFDVTRNVLAVWIDPPRQGGSPDQRDAFYDRALERAAATPGVEIATLANALPLQSTSVAMPVTVEGAATVGAARSVTNFNVVRPGFFRTLGIPIHRGRDFGPGDTRGAPGVTIVNETMAARLWPGRDPLGERLRIGGPRGALVQVVGVVKDSKYHAVNEQPTPYMYLPQLQQSRGMAGMILLVRAPGDATALAAPLRRMVRELDPKVPVYQAQTIASYVERHLAAQRRGITLLAAFAGLALLLAAIGLYGAAAYSVAQRRREIGIRMALGATSRDILRLFLAQGARAGATGIALGLLLAVAVTRLLKGLLVGVGNFDVLAFAGVALLLATVVLAASYLPARQAARVNPHTALRVD